MSHAPITPCCQEGKTAMEIVLDNHRRHQPDDGPAPSSDPHATLDAVLADPTSFEADKRHTDAIYLAAINGSARVESKEQKARREACEATERWVTRLASMNDGMPLAPLRSMPDDLVAKVNRAAILARAKGGK